MWGQESYGYQKIRLVGGEMILSLRKRHRHKPGTLTEPSFSKGPNSYSSLHLQAEFEPQRKSTETGRNCVRIHG
jgi:hypothetical protein